MGLDILRWHWGLLFLIIMTSFPGCQMEEAWQSPGGVTIPTLPNLSETQRWFEENPCGYLPVRAPFANVSGILTGSAQTGSDVSLYVMHNASFETGLFTVEHCAALMRVPVDRDHLFVFGRLPVGTYLIALPRSAFGTIQGFPVVPRFNESGLVVDTVWHGGDSEHSMAAFVVREAQPQPGAAGLGWS
jgi:hypothetical protein